MPPCGFLNFSSQRLLPPAYADSSSSVNSHLMQQQQGERPSRKAKKENKVCSFLPLSISPIHRLCSSTAFSRGRDLLQDPSTWPTKLLQNLAHRLTLFQIVAQESLWLSQGRNHPPAFNPDPCLLRQRERTRLLLLQPQKHAGIPNHLWKSHCLSLFLTHHDPPEIIPLPSHGEDSKISLACL